MMKRIESINTQFKSFELTATGGYAFYLILCTILATIAGTWLFMKYLAELLYPMIS